MKHEIIVREEIVIAEFEGDVDIHTSPDARKVLLDCVAHGMPVLVDLSKVNYIDSSGIASLVESLQTARKGGSDLALVSVSEAALRVLQLARLDKVFSIYVTIDEGVEGIG